MVLDITTAEYRQNPYPSFKKLRAEASVCRINPHGYWAISKYADVKMILKNPELFSSADIMKEPTITTPEFLLYSRGLIGTDKPDHTRLRRLLSKAFTPETINRFEPMIRLLCADLVKNMERQKVVDFVKEFSVPIPIMVISELMGIDPDKLNNFKRWTNLLVSWRNQQATSAIMKEVEDMFYYFTDIIAQRRQAPKKDFISNLILACDNDMVITSAEVLAFLRLLLVAGTETTTHLIGNAFLTLLSHPDIMQQIQQDYTKIPNFIEETLRYDGPALSLSRRVTTDVEISGIIIKKGEIVLPLLASANHDEEVFTNPEHFNLERDTQGHLAFGTGIHFCLGSQLARLQTRIAFEEFFKKFNFIKKIDTDSLTYLKSFFFRGLQSLKFIHDKNGSF